MRRAVLAVLGVVFLVLGGLAGTGFWLLRRNGPPPELLVQQTDGNLALVDAQGTQRGLTTDAGNGRFYSQPVPSPDGRHVAYVETIHATDVVSSALVVHRTRGGRRTVFESTDSRPFYLHWSPDSRQLAFLASDGQRGESMILRTVNILGAPVVHDVVPGNPSYFSWTPDGRRLLLHTGGSWPGGTISLWALGDTKPRQISSAPGLFQAPAWLDAGQTALVVVRDGDRVALVALAPDGTIRHRLAATGLGMLFSPAPDGQAVAYMPVEGNGLGNLRMVDADGSHDRQVTTMPALTFLWSPDGAKIAYLTPTALDGTQTTAWGRQEELRLTWHVLDVASGASRSLVAFKPSREFMSLIPYFDQYAHSIRLWDKGSSRLVYADEQGVRILNVTTGDTTRVDGAVLGMWIER